MVEVEATGNAPAIVLAAIGAAALISADVNVHGSTSPFNPLGEALGASGGWATKQVGPELKIAGHDYWVTTWEAVCWGVGFVLLGVGAHYSNVWATLMGLGFLAVGTTGFVWAWPFGS